MPIESKKRNTKGLFSGFLLVLPLLFLLSGCAGKPWSDTFKEDEVKAYKTMIETQIKKDSGCPSTLDSEIAVTWKSPVGTKAFSGYLQLQLPSSLKFVTINPLGQPLFALVSDGQVFSSVNTLGHQYISGSLASLALRNNIPQGLLTGNWGTWLSGRITTGSSDTIQDIRKDTSGRGIWVILKAPGNIAEGKEYILVDTVERHPILRILTNKNGSTTAQIRYGRWQKEGACGQPTSFSISDLPMGSEITLQFSDIILDKVFAKNNFTIMPPPGYFIQLLP